MMSIDHLYITFLLRRYSETTVELMKLAHSMLEEACTSTSAACSSQIVYAVRSMFELYTSVVGDYHRESIESLPQVTGK